MAVWAEVALSSIASADRFDAEYYRPSALVAEALIHKFAKGSKPLGELIHSGYRVVYENTEILAEANQAQDCRFLQATDIDRVFPTVWLDRMGWVSEADWNRYTKGRIVPGEILVEVKGEAVKVARVPDNFPTKTLVSGSVYKFQTNPDRILPRVLVAFFLSRYGLELRDRLKTNTLIGFVSKKDLYRILVPRFSEDDQLTIDRIMSEMETALALSRRWYQKAAACFEESFGISGINLSAQTGYETSLRDVSFMRRWDSEFYKPKYLNVIDVVRRSKKVKVSRFIPLGCTFALLANGHTPLRHDLSVGEVPFLTAEHVSDFRINFATEKRILLRHHTGELARTALQNGDVLVTIKGKVGNCAVVRNCPVEVNINQDVSLFRVRKGVHPYFVAAWFNSLIGKQLVEQRSTGGINPFLGLGNLRRMLFPVISEADQDRIGGAVQDAIEQAQESEARAVRLLETARNLIENLISDEAR